MARKRNEKGEGTVFKRNDGYWQAKMTKCGKTKKRNAATEKEAQQKLEEIKKEFRREERMAKHERDLKENPHKISTERIFRGFIEYKRTGRKNISQHSLQRLESTINTHILPKLGSVPFLEITDDDVNDLLDTMYQNNFSHSSIKKVHDAFSACFKYAIYVGKKVVIGYI